MAPKSKKNAPVVEEATEEPFEPPDDLPGECPFEVEWSPGIVLVQVERPLEEMAIKKDLLTQQACKCMHMQLEIAKAESSTTSPDLVARIQQARADVGTEGSLPAEVLHEVCLARWRTDQETDWQREWVRRKATLLVAEDAVNAATEACEVAAKKRCDAEDALAKEREVQQECGTELPTDADGLTTDGPMQPFYKARQQCSESLQMCEQQLDECKQGLVKAQSNCKVKWTKLRIYWTKGLPWSANEIRALQLAGLPVVATILLKASADGTDMTVDGGSEPHPYDAVIEAQQSVSWDDKILQIATVAVLTGADGGCFVNRSVYSEAGAVAAVEGAHEMAVALQRLEEASVAYRDWETQCTLTQLPDVPVNLSIYHSLLDSVPVEQQSVATVLHCLLEEVSCAVQSVEKDSVHDAWEVQQAKRFVDSAMYDRALPAVPAHDKNADVVQFSSIVEGDEPRMRSHGLLSGLVKRPAAEPQSCDNSSMQGLCLDGSVHPDAVEDHVADLLWQQWQHSVDPPGAPFDAKVQESVLQALANQAGIDWAMMQRFNVLKTAVSMLPEACREDHNDSMLRRHHAVEFSPEFMAARICQCLQCFPAHTWTIDEASGDYVLVCHGGSCDPSLTLKIPFFMPFSRYVKGYIASAPDFVLPELERVVYPISETESCLHRASAQRFLADGSWMDVKHEGHLRLQHGAAMVCVYPTSPSHVLLSGAHGLHTVIQVYGNDEAGGTASAVADADTGEASTAVSGPKVTAPQGSQPPGNDSSQESIAHPAVTAEHHCEVSTSMTATAVLPAGVELTCHCSGTFVFKDCAKSGGGKGKKPILRTVFHDGSVVLPLQNGTWLLRYPDGSTCEQLIKDQPPEDASLENVVWLSTSVEGQRVGLRLPPPQPSCSGEDGQDLAEVEAKQAAEDEKVNQEHNRSGSNTAELELCQLGRLAHTAKVDPDMKASIITRADHTMCIKYPTGDTLVLWPDGSRTATSSDGTWTVEADGVPCVRGGPDHMTCQIAMDTTMTWSSSKAAITIEQDCGALLVAAKGTVCCSLSPARSLSANSLADVAVEACNSGDALNDIAQSHPSLLVVDMLLRRWAVKSGAVEDQVSLDIFDGSQLRLGALGSAEEPSLPACTSKEDAPPTGQPDNAAADDVVVADRQQTPDETSVSQHTDQDQHARSSKTLAPRVFVVSHGTGGGIELIPPDEYTSYVGRFKGRQGVTDSVQETSSSRIKLHRFVKDYAAVSSTMAALHVSEGATVAPAEYSQALASLKMPCKSYVAPTTGLVLPRLAAASDSRANPQLQESVLVVKEFLVHDAPKDEDLEEWQALHAQCEDQLAEFARGTAETTVQSQRSVSPEQAKLLQRLRALEQDAAQRAAQVKKDHQRTANAAAGTRIMLEQEAVEFAGGAAAAQVKDYRAWQHEPGEFDMCPQLPQPGQLLQYFASEEGLRAQREDPLLSSGRQGILRSLPTQRAEATLSESYADKGMFGLTTGPADTPDCDSDPGCMSSAKLAVHDSWQVEAQADMEEAGSSSEPREGQCLRTYPADQMGPGGVKLPRISTRPQRATTTLNDAYLHREYQAMHTVKTASAELIRARGMDDVEFKLSCHAIDFGEVTLGTVVQRRLGLHNVSLERARFSVDQVALPLKLSYPRAPVPAGLRTQIMVELHAGEAGQFEGLVVVRSAVNVLECTVRATIVPARIVPAAED